MSQVQNRTLKKPILCIIITDGQPCPPLAACRMLLTLPTACRSAAYVTISQGCKAAPAYTQSQEAAWDLEILPHCAGEPTGEPKNRVAQVISQAKQLGSNSQYGPGAIAFEFAQVRLSASVLQRSVTSWAAWAASQVVMQHSHAAAATHTQLPCRGCQSHAAALKPGLHAQLSTFVRCRWARTPGPRPSWHSWTTTP